MAYKYITADNWGKDFFTHEERNNFYLFILIRNQNK